MDTKVIAFYLPQYHEVPENNEWWGKGFTEWTNVRSGKPFFNNHYQPKVPLNNNYYDLSNVKNIENQAQLAQKYKVDGFCFYHYWFMGKKLLEKPLEVLLENPQVDISFCISWANETWSRRWTGEEKEILIKQEYGKKNDWEEHIKYFLNIFKDKRYICINNKPILLMYRSFEIPDCDEMINYWNKRLIEEGFNGIYVIETLNSIQKKSILDTSSAVVEFEPMFTIHKDMGFWTRLYRYCFNHMKLSEKGFRDYLDYDYVFKKIVKRKRSTDKKVYLGAFPDWDNTSRRGNTGLVIKNSTPDKFRKFFNIQYQKSMELQNEFIFINAWNEWGEGAYLEPDTKNQYQYLEAIKEVITANNNLI